MLKNIVGKTVEKVEMILLEENLPDQITITFTDKSSVTFTATNDDNFPPSYIIVSEFEIITINKEELDNVLL